MPDFSPLPSAANNALLNLKFIAEDTTIYLSPPNNGLGKTGSAGTWTGLTWGSDDSGDGTLAKPFATLRRAWTEAQKYTITGNATLYIQFQKGIYGYTYDTGNTGSNPFPDNLYHPQGGNIVIQGDLNAIKQRYIYRVKDYSWDLSRVAYFGHTGTVNTWYAVHAGGDTAANYPLGNGNTAHGFSAEDEFGYVSVSNAFLHSSTIIGYNDALNGVASAKYTNTHGHNFGRHVYNHGLSYEDSQAILGLARIEGASSSAFDLALQFKWINLDGRINTYPNTTVNGKLPGGLGNGLTGYGTLGNNPCYPEPQYSQPNGFYGPTFGVSSSLATIDPYSSSSVGGVQFGIASGVSVGYPARNAGEVHVSDDAHLLTNFPVVIKTYSSGSITFNNGTNAQPIPLVIEGGTIKSIRNLMFVNGHVEGASYGAKSVCSGWDHQLNAVSASVTRYASNPGMIVQDGGSTSIRNLGFLGYGLSVNSPVCVYVNNGTLLSDMGFDASNYMEYSPGVHNVGSTFYYPKLGLLMNTPIFVSSHSAGIHVDGPNGVVDFTNGFRTSSKLSDSYCNQAVLMQSITPATNMLFSFNNAKMYMGPLDISYNSYTPGYTQLRLDIPQFSGSTLSNGLTAAFYVPEIFANTRGDRYKSVVGYKNQGGTRTAVLRAFNIIETTVDQKAASTGWTLGTWRNGAGTVVNERPVKNQSVIFHCQKLNTPAFDTIEAVRSWLNASAGNTLEFFAYSNNTEGTTLEYLGLGNGGIVLGCSGGTTLSCSTTALGTNKGTEFGLTLTNSSANGVGERFKDYVRLYGFGANNGHSILTSLGGKFYIAGNAIFRGRCYSQIVSSGGDSVVKSARGAISIRDFTHSGVLVQQKPAILALGGVHIKHPFGFGYGGWELGNDYGYGIYSRHGAYLSLGYNSDYHDPVVIGLPYSRRAHVNEAGQNMGFYNKGGTTELGINTANISIPFLLDHNTQSDWTAGTYISVIAAFDGGYYAESSDTTAIKYYFGYNSLASGCGALWHIWNTSQGQSNLFINTMTRGTFGLPTSGNGTQLMYNIPRGMTMWWIKGATGWVGGSGTPSTSNNLLYKSPVNFGGAGSIDQNLIPSANQIASAFTANPPGYSGPALYRGTQTVLNAYYSSGGG